MEQYGWDYDFSDISAIPFRETEMVLPEWLDDCLSEMGAVYRPKDTRYQYTLDLSEPRIYQLVARAKAIGREYRQENG